MTEIEQATEALIAAIKASRGPKPKVDKRLAEVCLKAVALLNEQLTMSRLTPERRKKRETALAGLRSKYLVPSDAVERAINEQCIPLFVAAKTDHQVDAAVRKLEQLKRDRALERFEAWKKAGPPPPEPVSEFSVILSQRFSLEPPEPDDPITNEEWDWVVKRAVQRCLNAPGSRPPSPHEIWKDVRKRRKYYEEKAEKRARTHPHEANARATSLKAELFKAHPDHGGSNEAFRKAYKHYQKAKRGP